MKKMFAIFAGLLLVSAGAFAQDSADPTDQCQVDADCPAQFVCRTVQIPCTAIACEPCECLAQCTEDDAGCGCVCPVCDVPECTDEGSYNVCSWEPVECATDSGCPDGFECVIQEICTGVSCTCPACVCDPTTDAGCECPDVICDCGDLPDPECIADGGWCMPKPVECTTDDDCTEGFACVSSGGVTSCLCPDCACMPCAPDSECLPCDCDVACACDQDVVEGPSYCMPAQWGEYVEFRDGEPAYESLLASEDTLVPIQDEDANGVDNATGGTGETSTSNCSAGRTGSFPWLLILPIGIAFTFRRRFSR